MSPQLIICDFAFKGFWENRLFDYNLIKNYPGASVWPLLKDRVSKGYECITSDVFLKRDDSSYQKAFLISEMITPLTAKVLKRKNVIPLCVLSGESPNVAIGFYKNLKKNTDFFHNAMLFEGCKEYVSDRTNFIPFYWPNRYNQILHKSNWKDRKYLVMIASNKKRLMVNENKLFSKQRQFLKSCIWNI